MLRTRLIGMGDVPAIRAKDLKVGYWLVWNYGVMERIESITPSKSGKTLTVTLTYGDDDKLYTRKLNVNRIVAATKDETNFLYNEEVL